MATYTMRVEMAGDSYLVETTGENRWNILEPKGIPEDVRDQLIDLLREAGELGTPWAGGFPEETRYSRGVIDAFPGSTVVKVDPEFEFEEGVVY